MELQFFGANCVKLILKNATVVVDDNLSKLGLKPVTKKDDIALFSSDKLTKTEVKDSKLIIDMAGEYEVSGVSIRGVPVRSHTDEEGQESAVVYKIITSDVNVALAGHMHPDLTEDQLEAIGTVDVLFVPVGGNGYTLDAVGALKVIKKIEPKIIIPTHYADSKINYEVPQSKLEDALKEMSLEVKDRVSKLKIKGSELPDIMELVVIERQ